MTGDRGELPPYHRSSSLALSPASSPQHSNGNGQMADLRERVRAIETAMPLLERIATDRLSSHTRRMDGTDTRLAEGDRRMDRLDSRVSETERAMTPLPAIEARLAHIERRAASWKSSLQYAVAALIFGLVLARRMTVEQAFWLLKLLLPPLSGA